MADEKTSIPEQKPKFPTHLDHLNKTFLEELSYKVWITKGARFCANKRLLLKNDWSNKAIGFLSAYLIILGLCSVYQVSRSAMLYANYIAFGSTALSILLLVFGQLEAAQDYKVKAHQHHDCALKLSSLYNEIRVFKTMELHTAEEKQQFASTISQRYQQILNNCINHDDIDYKLALANKPDYHTMGRWRIFTIKMEYYYRTAMLYHVLIVLPLTAFTFIYPY